MEGKLYLQKLHNSILVHVLSLSFLQNIPLAKAADMVLAGQGEEEPIGIILLQLLDFGLAQKNNATLLFFRES